jgi:hypothetical protein
MKQIFIWMLLNVSFISINAQNFSWAKKGGLWAYDYGYGITNDNYGNVYVAGKYEQNAKFSDVVLPCQGNHDIFVAQYSPTGNLNWIKTAGGYTGDYATCIATDGNYLYVGGEIEGTNATIYFQGSPITLKCQNSNDIFLAKYTTSGTLLWAKRAGGNDYEKALGITYDNAGNVLICGLFRGAATFGGTTTIYSSGENDIFVAKYDANGNFLWVKKAGSAGRDEAKSIKCDAYGNIYISGMYKNGCTFGSQWLSSPGSYFNMFVAKYSSGGSLQWVKTGGGNYDDVGWSLALDNYGKIYVTGEFNATANFSGQTIWTTGSADVFVACYDPNGNIQWIRKAGGSQTDRARGIAVAGNKIYITGQFGGTAYFGPYTKYAADNSDIFIACLDNYGTFKWALSAGGSPDAAEELGYESGNAIAAQTNGNVYATGSMLNGATFGSTSLSAYTRTDVFVVKVLAPPSNRSDDNLMAVEENGETEIIQDDPERSFQEQEIKEELTELNIYPNPGDGYFVLEFNAKESAQYEIIVFNSLGQIIEKRQITVPSVTNIDLANREKGIYFVELRNAEAFQRKKVILR